MAQTMVNFRMDEELKKNMEQICQDMGMSMTTALTIFLVKLANERRIPFEITSPDEEITRERGLEAFYELREQARRNGIQGMSLDEINEEIRLTREEMRRRTE